MRDVQQGRFRSKDTFQNNWKYFSRYRRQNLTENDEKSVQDGVNVLADAGENAFQNIIFVIIWCNLNLGGISYGDYLELDKVLNAQTPQSRAHGELKWWNIFKKFLILQYSAVEPASKGDFFGEYLF